MHACLAAVIAFAPLVLLQATVHSSIPSICSKATMLGEARSISTRSTGESSSPVKSAIAVK